MITGPLDKPKPYHRRFQFSLKSLMIAVLVVGSCLGLLATKMMGKQRERRAVAAIEDLGGSVQYDWQDDDGNGTAPGPKWIRALAGDDFFADVAAVEFWRQDRQVADDDLLHLDLDSFTKLKYFHIASGRVTDLGLVRLDAMTELESVWIAGVWPHDQITDASTAYLKRMHRLSYVRLASGQVTDAGAANLGQITTLKTLYLFCTKITDAGLRHIGRNTSLEKLTLCSTHITDEGLGHLCGMTSLHQLTLQMTQVTTAGVVGLQKALPNCQFVR